jgi:chromosome segregation ATPase
MSRLKNLNKLAKAKAFELTACQGNLAELHAQTRHLDEQLRLKDSKLADMKSEFAARTGSADRGAVALRHELSSLQDSLADCRQRRADAEALKRQLEHAVSQRLLFLGPASDLMSKDALFSFSTFAAGPRTESP